MIEMKTKWLKSACWVAALACVAPPICFGGDIVFLSNGGEQQPEKQQLELVARFYGLGLKAIPVQSKSDVTTLLNELKRPDTLAVVATAEILSALPRNPVFSNLKRATDKNVPLLIVDITPRTDTEELRAWSNSAVSGCTTLSPDLWRRSYTVGSDRAVTGELSGEELPSVSVASCSFSINQDGAAVSVLSMSEKSNAAPVFVKTGGRSSEVFFLAQIIPAGSVLSGSYAKLIGDFSNLAPQLMFVRYAANDRGWHSVQHTANLTIDDPWLTEPYGYLSYQALLGEMEKHNFHTTIAFIPWNFDRSQPEVSALFREHGERLSVSLHGNNHDHKEFDDYATVALDDQIADIKQGIARMEKFQALTRIPYDRVMIFPHSIAPENTLAVLKRYDFLATVNSDDVPIGAQLPDDALFALRAFTLKFGNFPSLRRYSVEIPLPHVVLAINSFLDNPLLFYGHEALFERGIGAFDETADAVNHIEPATQWCSLGCVAQHLYLIRLRADGNFDAKVFGTDFTLENRSGQVKFFFVQKDENSVPKIRSLTVDGQEQTFNTTDNQLTLKVSVPPRTSRHVHIAYENDLDLAKVDTSKDSIRVSLLRKASDFRDNTLPKYRWGRSLTRFYYRHEFSSLEFELEKWWLSILVLTFSVIGFFFLRRRTVIGENRRACKVGRPQDLDR